MPGVRRRTTRPREAASRKHEEKLRAANPQIKKARRGRASRVVRIGSAQVRIEAPQAQHMETGERGCQECDGKRRGRGRVLAAGRRREKKLHAANPRGKKAGAGTCHARCSDSYPIRPSTIDSHT